MKHGRAEVLHLLLSHADGRRPFLEQGLPAEAAGRAPEPERVPGRADVPWLEAPEALPDDLPAQRWGVIAPEGREGDAMRQAVAPLIQHRAGEQGAEVRLYRAPANLDALGAVKWRKTQYRIESEPEAERPKYLLILGDLHQVSIELQHVLAHGAYVGRLHISRPSGEPDLEGYTAYANKVRAFETDTAASEAPDVLLFAADDGSNATRWGRELLVEPCQKLVEQRWMPKRPGLRLQVLSHEQARLEQLLRAAATARAGVMLSVSHGLGLPTPAEASVEEQRARQGALDLGGGQVLAREQLRDTPFLPGGMWFSLACFSAATPPRSMFHPWLAQLAQQKVYESPLDAVLQCLPRPDARPFVTALPQAALSNPRGPLAIIGHSDLAWMFSFSEGEAVLQSRASRIASVLEVLSKGSRAGVALDTLMRVYRDANDDLAADAHVRRQAELDGAPDPVDPREHAYRWMLRNDLRGYILLGDPAARLSFRSATA
ncbi:hypothetical protein [Pyxidicoccus xibeiensis]|uniref:hypothetical protein n=1 Tax=Pyxidicoccus xibeiensis TaxID=2906759 RepID=UPI0020A7EB30|nr:hypothetical protein [Pyxidicoccus xibeiensis]MCP3142238.1 hypothetical protein [Pyxidicoccus xibeiensis]